MKLLNKLLGKDTGTPTWDIKPESERPPPKAREQKAAPPPPPAAQNEEPDPFLDDLAVESMELEAEIIPEDNPYDTLSWEDSMENDTRKLKTIQMGDKPIEKPGSEFNPYDTGKMKRGWKG
jgi:hypothetical protein